MRAALWLLRLAAVLLCSICTTSLALDPGRTLAEYVRDSWNSHNGFSGGQVNAFAQTPDGYLWIGADRGLYRFDGRTFVDARQLDPSMPNPLNVLGLTTDSEGSLWVRVLGPNFLRYRSGRFEDYFTVRSDNERSITAMNCGPQGDLLISTLSHGKLHYRGGAFQTILPPDRPTSLVIAMAETPDGQIWAGTRDQGISRLTSHGLDPLPGVLPDNKVNVILPAENGRLWIGTDNGLALWNGSSVTTAGIPPPLQKVQILTLLRDADANLWVGTPHGLLRMDRNNTTSYATSGDTITALFEDREGNLWVGSHEGIQRLRDSSFVIRALPGVPSSSGGPIYVDQQGRAWIAPSSGGLVSVLNGQVTHIAAAGLDHDVVYSIDGGSNELWLGRRSGGLTHLRLQNGAVTSSQTYTRADGLPQSSIYAVHRNRDGSVWAATVNGGASELRNGKITTFTINNGLPSNSVTAIEDSPEATWLATSNGLARLTRGPSGPPEWETLTSQNGLPSDDIISLLPDSAGYLWIGTSAGLAVQREGRIQQLPRFPALHEPIFGIAEDRRGMLWIATSSRLLSVDVNSLLQGSPAAISLREYGPADGLPGTEGVRRNRSVVSDANGRIWFSLNQGIATADPSRIFATAVPAITHIESLTADGNLIPLSKAIRLPASSKRLTFNFDGLSLAAPDRVQYRYRLDGFDRSWSEPTSLRQAVYTNLAPGDYRFHVLSSTPNDQWGGHEATYSFSIEPAAWQTWWFQLALACALGLLASFIFHARMRQMTEKLNLRFEERLAERTRLAQELHDTLLQGFLSASMQLHVAAEQLPADSPVRSSLDRILDLMQKVNQEGRNTLRGLRSEAVDSTTLEQAFSQVPHDLAPSLSSSANHPAFRVIVQGQARALHPVIRDEVCRIGRESIFNAFLHAQATAIEVEVEYTPGSLHLFVRDDGIGIDPGVLRSGREGHWGLVGMRERASSIGANLKLFSRAGAGTEVELEVPGNIAYQHPTNGLGHQLTRLWARSRKRPSS